MEGFCNVLWDSLWYVPEFSPHSEISLIKWYVPELPLHSEISWKIKHLEFSKYSRLIRNLILENSSIFFLLHFAPPSKILIKSYHNVLKLPVYLSEFPTLSSLGKQTMSLSYDYFISSVYLVQGLTHGRFSTFIYTNFVDKKTQLLVQGIHWLRPFLLAKENVVLVCQNSNFGKERKFPLGEERKAKLSV